MNYKLCVIVCYFGVFPSYFELWLKACSCNPTVDFIIYSDVIYSKKLPSNVKIINTSLIELKKKAEMIVGFKVRLERAYKLCDFRPLFGEMFKTDIKDYDFWGYCDLDIIFGDIRKFITDDLLEKYDKLNRWGHLSFHRNNEEYNNRFRLESERYSYKEVLTRTRDFGFDEFDYTFIHKKYGFPIYIFPDNLFADIRARYKRFHVQGQDNYDYQIFYWENGHVYREYYENEKLNKNEYLYIHFKKRGNLKVHFNEKTVKAFYITKEGFYFKESSVNIEAINKFNPFVGRKYEKYEDYRYRINAKLHKIKRKYFE